MLLLPGAALASAPDEPAQLLKYADAIKSENNAEFVDILKKLGDASATLPSSQQLYLRYLNAWQRGYSGDYEAAIPMLNAIIDQSTDVTLRFRAGVSAVNILAIAAHYDEAYLRLSQLLDLLPHISDRDAIEQAFVVAAILYNQAGQYDLGSSYAEKLFAEGTNGANACKGVQLKNEALYKSGKLEAFNNEFQAGIDTCVKVNEPLWTNLIRTYVATFDIEQGRVAEAIALLKKYYDEAQRTHYPRLMSEFDSILAQAYWKSGDVVDARRYAQSAIDKSVKNQITKPLVDAYRVLYQAAQKEGDYQSALAFHEKYAAADKGYLNDVSARTLAYQMVSHQVTANKLQIDSLNKQNQVLQLQQALDRKAAETGRLYVALLLSVLGFIALWAYKTKRSQLRFKTLARRDGLTGIFNRQHFVEAAKSSLQYCAKSAREACVVVIDLDHFKLINDAHGHAAGDMVLKRAVSACQAHLRSIDSFGRLGGEEFGIALPDCTLETALIRAEELRVAIAELGEDADLDFTVSASFGIASTTGSGYDLRQLLIDADNALYEAKREGRNRVSACQSRTSVGVQSGSNQV
ncbi:MAG: GGDEF domain-containing protein [Rudaea sp.]|nr:GGDEF domain-containing protein [Rudaea sp.]